MKTESAERRQLLRLELDRAHLQPIGVRIKPGQPMSGTWNQVEQLRARVEEIEDLNRESK